uniref:Uncharacterized protein MANES_14G085600 n=1 Tax=Rhizophora mucronata TaxID=61149 RepID=A0A2P2PL63_RHIMU
MTSKYSYILKVYEAKTASPDPVPNPGCNIEMHIRYRYQLKIPSNEGTMAVIEDLITPEQRTTLRIPVFFPLARWRELYLSDVLLPTNLDINMRNILNPRVSKAIASVAERNGNKGFDIVVKVGILKAETMSKEEVSRIAARLAKMEVSADSLQSPAPQLLVIDETEACMSNVEDLGFVS